MAKKWCLRFGVLPAEESQELWDEINNGKDSNGKGAAK